MITIKDGYLLCTNCGGRHLLTKDAARNVRHSDAFKVLHENCKTK